MAILRTVPAGGEIVSGRITLHGKDLLTRSEAEMAIRSRHIAMVFQDPRLRSTPSLLWATRYCASSANTAGKHR